MSEQYNDMWEMRHNRTSSRRRSSKKGKGAFTTSRKRNLKTQASVLGGFGQHRGRHAVYFTLVNPQDTNPVPQFSKAYKHLKSCHDAVNAVDTERAQEEPLNFFWVLNGCVICFDTLPKECLKRVIETRDKAGPCTNTRVAVAYSPQSRHSDTAPKKRHQSNLHAVVVGRGTLLEETLGVTQTQQTNWVVQVSAASLELQKKGHLEEDEKTDSSRFHCSCCGNQYIIGTTFCRCGAKTTESDRRSRKDMLNPHLRKASPESGL